MPTTYRYPYEDTEYKAKVLFSLVKEEKTGEAALNSLKSNINKNTASAKSLQDQITDLELEIVNEGSSTQRQEKRRALYKQKDELLSQARVWAGLAREAQNKPTILISTDSVQLYLPAGLAFRDNVAYENVSLGNTGATMMAAADQGLGFASSLMKGVGSFITNISGGGGADLAKLAGIQLSSVAGSFADEARAVQKLSGGVTLNPNERVLFKQPNIREFSFTFKFVAKSQKEAEQVENIIKFFRTELYPDEISASVGETSIALGYKFPNKFNIGFEYAGEEIPGLAKIKPCYLKDVSTTYNASQMAMHSDGRFMEVDMTLMFQETKALTRKDIEEGGY